MTDLERLRDDFAAKAMAALLVNLDRDMWDAKDPSALDRYVIGVVAWEAYCVADAMLEARKPVNPTDKGCSTVGSAASPGPCPRCGSPTFQEPPSKARCRRCNRSFTARWVRRAAEGAA